MKYLVYIFSFDIAFKRENSNKKGFGDDGI